MRSARKRLGGREPRGHELDDVAGAGQASAPLARGIRAEGCRAPVGSVHGVRDLGQLGRTSEVRMRLTLNNRTANVITVWHYDYWTRRAYPTT
jgi:hypothetical protein